MRGRQGAALVCNPMTGELLAAWNSPVAFGRAFPPGSTAKLVETTAALEEGVISPDDRIFCQGVPELLGEPFRCSHPPPNAPYDLVSALANSCNYYFVALSTRLTSRQLAHWYAVFGFGNPLPSGPPEASPGQVRVGETEVERARAALGEGAILATPVQLLLAYSAIAARGQVYLFGPSSSGRKRTLLRRVPLRPRTFEILSAGLEECVRSGTSQAAAVPGVAVAGKTGTATALDASGATHAWFVGYAPAAAPEIALVIFLERGTGARDAASLAGSVLNQYFELKRPKP